MKILVLDNYDSFVYNLVQYIGEMEADIVVYRNNMLTLEMVRNLKPDRIVISPGPGTPDNNKYFGLCAEIIRVISPQVPTLGVCLGHQGIISVFGGRIVRAKRLMHGKTSMIQHDGEGIFEGLPNPFKATRYHSLVGDRDTIPECLQITAEAIDDGEIMGVRHMKHPIEGVQFHPESILTKSGKMLLSNFLYGKRSNDN